MNGNALLERFSIRNLTPDARQRARRQVEGQLRYPGSWNDMLGNHLTLHFFDDYEPLGTTVPLEIAASAGNLRCEFRIYPRYSEPSLLVEGWDRLRDDLSALRGPIEEFVAATRALIDRFGDNLWYKTYQPDCGDAGFRTRNGTKPNPYAYTSLTAMQPNVEVVEDERWNSALDVIRAVADPIIAAYAQPMYETMLDDLASIRGWVFDADGNRMDDAGGLSRAVSHAACSEIMRRHNSPIEVKLFRESSDFPGMNIYGYSYLDQDFSSMGFLLEDPVTGLCQAGVGESSGLRFRGKPKRRDEAERSVLRQGASWLLQ